MQRCFKTRHFCRNTIYRTLTVNVKCRDVLRNKNVANNVYRAKIKDTMTNLGPYKNKHLEQHKKENGLILFKIRN